MIRHTLIVILSLFVFQLASAQSSGFGKDYKGGKPFRIYYFAYEFIHPGVMMGPEYDFIYAKTDKISCETGVKYIDKQVLFAPQFGFVTDTLSNFSIFVNLEVDYRVIYDNAFIFEMFLSPGYALKFGDGSKINDSELDELLTDNRSRFMPQVGIGAGYSLHKKDITNMLISLRVLSASTEIRQSFFKPAFQLGISYNL
ncbi:MAG: hypothetical protein H7Y00_15560 [Fimbriimonadaceae bacterium]|nr:hypothetical protein [Chitinophagales bacterium]